MELVTEVDNQMSVENIAEEKKDLIANVDFKMVTFSLAGKDYAIDIMNVKEIAKTGRFTFVPNTSHFVLGVYNLRGDIIPIIDLRLFFNIPIPERNNNEIENMIIVSIDNQIFGVVVDAIDKVVGIQKSTIQPPHPLFGDINIKYIYGVVENADRLYVLLDIESIFGFKNNVPEEKNADDVALSLVAGANVGMAPGAANQQKPAAQMGMQPVKVPAAPSAPKPAPKADDVSSSPEFGFLTDTLSKQKKFFTTSVNDGWVKHRFSEWAKEKGAGKTQLQSVTDCDEFLQPFYSACTGKFWTEEFCDAVYKVLPDNAAKQIHVWNLGCAKGYETYSLACILKKRYPDSRIRIYAHDIDLISISNAPMMSVPDAAVNSWLKPYLTKAANGNNTFIQDIKDSILFEYHDCMNSGNMPASDIIFARDVISFLTPQAQDSIFEQFVDQLKGNGILILGENETCGTHGGWQEKMTGSIVVYTK